MKFSGLKKILGVCLCSVSIAGAIGVGSMAMTKDELVKVRNSLYHEGMYEARGVVDILISLYRTHFKEVEASEFYDAMAGLFKFMYYHFNSEEMNSNLSKINSALRTCLVKSGNSQSDFFSIEKGDIARCFLHCVLIERLSCEDACKTVLKIIGEKDLDGIIRRSHNDLIAATLLSVDLLDKLNELVVENEKGKVEEASETHKSDRVSPSSSPIFIPGMSSLRSYEENSKHFMSEMADDCYKSNYTGSKSGYKRSKSSSDVDFSEFDSSRFLMDIDHNNKDESEFTFRGSPIFSDMLNDLYPHIQLDDVDINELGKVDLKTLSKGKRMSDMSRIRGFFNFDLSCYMNASVAQLYFMDGFRDYILSLDAKDEKTKALQCLFRYFSGDESVTEGHVRESRRILGHRGETGLADSFWESLGVFKEDEGTLPDGSRYRMNIYEGKFLELKEPMLEVVKKVQNSSSCLGTGEEYVGYNTPRVDGYIYDLPVDFEYTNEGINYRLSDIVVYDEEHYYLLHRDVETGEWYEINDSIVKKLTQEEVESIARKSSYFRLYKKA